MKLPIKHVVPVLLSVAAVLGQSGTDAQARARHRAQTQVLTPLSWFDARPAVASAGEVQKGRVRRVSRRHGRDLVRYANNEVGSASTLSDASNAAPAVKLGGFGGSDLVSEARRYLGGNPTGKASLWCGNFMNLVLDRTGHAHNPSNTARSFASYGQRVSGPQVGAIAVMSRQGGGHVGVVSGIDAKGNIVVVSGNHGHRVAESTYPASRIYAYVMPK